MDIFRSRKTKYWKRVFSNCDFDFAADLLVHVYANGIIPNELSILLTSYTNNPGRESAIKLIEFDDQEFLRFFVDNKTELVSMMNETELSRDELSRMLRKNVGLLLEEPEFIDYCEGILGEGNLDSESQSKKNALLAKGYTEEMISEAMVIHVTGG